jgi:LmbE family N-acetylglucosaminyl deacetylase
MFTNKNKILVIAAHPDDEILGCGATLSRAIKEYKANVQCVFVTDSTGTRYKVDSIEYKKNCELRKKQAIKSSRLLGANYPLFLDFPAIRITREIYPEVSQKLEKIINQFSPKDIFVHNGSDNNYDHRIVFEATMTAVRSGGEAKINSIYSYEIPSATDDYNDNLGEKFTPNYIVNAEKYIHIKLKILRQCYLSEMRTFPHPRSLKSIKNLAIYRGTQNNLYTAEAFYLIKKKIY